jgi:protein-S-isoprenylcysteine O-methyltransferase Ste14
MNEEDSRMTPSGSEHPLCDRIQLVMIILFFVVWGLDSFVFTSSTALMGWVPLPLRILLGCLGIGTGTYLGVQSHRVVFGNPSTQPRLIDSGVYTRVRHPMYLGTLLFCLGFFGFTLSLLSLGVWSTFFIFYDRMASYEENDLIRVLGNDYVSYQKQVPKWFPRVRPKR